MSLDSLISALLFEAEGAELDFKREQYLFSGADDRTKSELLKDILAFANAWRRTDAYILIGVQEIKESASMVVGITEHIDDARLQQFVNSKTNRPIEFSYTPTQFQGKQVGVIHIPLQDRPTFLTKDYGALRRNTVYLRRSSSTDEARPDEIARMGLAISESIKLRPLLTPILAVGSDWSELNENATFDVIHLNQPEIGLLPDYSPPEPTGTLGIHFNTPFRYRNANFYRERAEYLRFSAKLRPLRLGIRNDGNAIASDVKLIAHIADPEHLLEFSVGKKRPKMPAREWSPIDNIRPTSVNQTIPDVEITKTNAGWTIKAYFGKIQAKDTRLTDEKLFAGTSQSGKVDLPVSVYADELPSPVSSTLVLNFKVTEKELTFDQLTS